MEPSRRIKNVSAVCENCGKAFLAKTSITRFCYDEKCIRERNAKRLVKKKKILPFDELAPAPVKMKKRELKAWNKEFPVGTCVIVTKDLREQFRTVIRSKGWLLENGYPLVLVNGIRGGYSISRIRKDEQDAN